MVKLRIIFIVLMACIRMKMQVGLVKRVIVICVFPPLRSIPLMIRVVTIVINILTKVTMDVLQKA